MRLTSQPCRDLGPSLPTAWWTFNLGPCGARFEIRTWTSLYLGEHEAGRRVDRLSGRAF
jgi:hypothetical protein